MKILKNDIDWVSFRSRLKSARFRPKFFEFLKWVLIDVYRAVRDGNRIFREYGVTLFCGKQGAGKTIAMVEYLERMRILYPDVMILTNFDYVHQTASMVSWEQLLSVRNGDNGVIFAIDEIQNEYDSTKWANFPENLLSQITMQRKQRIKIVTTSQVFTRVVKQLREQCYEVVECRTLLHRWTFCRAFDAYEYEAAYTMPDKKQRLSRSWRYSFVQTDAIRSLYDSYAIVKRMASMEMLPREVRGMGR